MDAISYTSAVASRCSQCGHESSAGQAGLRCEHCGQPNWSALALLTDELPFVDRQATISDLHAADKRDAIAQVVHQLVATGTLDPTVAPDVVETVMRREQLGSTGIGRGVAIPHAKHPGVDRLIAAIAWSEQGVPFDSIDREPVHLLVLLITPPDRAIEHLRTLEKISRLLAGTGDKAGPLAADVLEPN